MKPTIVRNLCLATLIVAQFAAIALLVFSMQSNLASRINDGARQDLNRLASNLTDQTQLYLAQAESALVTGNQLIADGVLRVSDDRGLERFFIAQLKSSEWLNGMYLGRSDGSFVYVSRHPEGIQTKRIRVTSAGRQVRHTQYDHELNQLLSWLGPRDSYDPRQRPWYAQAIQADGITWTDPYRFFTSEQPGLSAARVVFRGTRRTSVMGVDIEIAALSAFLGRMPGSHQDNGQSAVITDATGSVVAASRPEQLDKLLRDQGTGATVALQDPILVALSQAQQHERPEPGLAPGFIEFNVNDNQHYGVSRPFNLTHARGQWRLLAQIPASGYSSGIVSYLSERMLSLLALIFIPAVIAAGLLLYMNGHRLPRRRQPSRDSVTGALSRHGFERQLSRLMNSTRFPGTTLVVAAIDIDNFKRINARYGHHAGDVILREAAGRMRRALGREGLICRTGADHFLVATRVRSRSGALDTMERLHGALTRNLVKSNVARHDIGATIGVATHGDDETEHELILRAGQALVTGKFSAKNRCYLAPQFNDLAGDNAAESPAQSEAVVSSV